MAVIWNPTCSGLAGRAFVNGPREFGREDLDAAFVTVTMEDEVEFDLDALLLCDMPLGVEFDILYPGFKTFIDSSPARLMLAIRLCDDVQLFAQSLAVRARFPVS